jgi:ribosomal protein S12 methylthiotransferase
MPAGYWVETLGCPKNQVDSDKLGGRLEADGYVAAADPAEAEVVVVNTCAFIESARAESIETILSLAQRRRSGARLVVTGCLAERHGQELADALPEVDQVAGFGVPLAPPVLAPGQATPVSESQRVTVLPTRTGRATGTGREAPSFDLLNLPRPRPSAPWAYVKVAEGCDRRCGFCAIPSFRGPQRSRSLSAIVDEVESLGVAEVILVAQDLASYGRDRSPGGSPRERTSDIVSLVAAVAERVPRTRLLYLYPSGLSASLIDVMGAAGCEYFDLSLQHVSRPHLRRMRRWGDQGRFCERIATIRRRYPDAALRSSFIVGYPGETEEDHDQLLAFLAEVELDWAGFFPFSPEAGTLAVGLPDQVPDEVVAERLAECGELQDGITARRRAELIGSRTRVLVDDAGVARSHREAPEIDGVINVPDSLAVGEFVDVEIVDSAGPDLEAVPLLEVNPLQVNPVVVAE